MVKKKTTKKAPVRRTRKKVASGPVAFELAADLGIADVKTLSESLSKLSSDQSEIVLDASRVETVDTAVLQMLVAFARDHVNLRWKDPSEAFRKTAALLDLEQHLGLDSSVDEGTGTKDNH